MTLDWTRPLEGVVAAVRDIAEPFEREAAARAAIEELREAMMALGHVRSEAVDQLLEDPPDGMSRDEIAKRLGLQNVSYLYALARPARRLREEARHGDLQPRRGAVPTDSQ